MALEQIRAIDRVQHPTGVGTRYQEAGRVQNVLARMAGTQSGGPAVLLVAHYDSVEAGPGAADDGAATAAILETIRASRAGDVSAGDQFEPAFFNSK
jgi:acetylornithine deacetylase/succinyl-diaminopimelate desuccinylase-like protein